MNLIDIARMTEDEAREMLERIRWNGKPTCPHCGGSEKIYELNGKAHRPGVYKCGHCRKQFTVTVKTVMEGTRIPLNKWILAFYSMCAHKKSVSAAQLQRDLGLGSYKTAWHLCHRIRLAMQEEPLASLLNGIVEVDETYVGGKGKGKRGRGSVTKTPVVALIERNGRARSKPVKRVNAAELKGEIRKQVNRAATIMTDEWRSYTGIGKEFDGGHHVVNHGRGEYANGIIYTNNAESYFAIFKRGLNGTYHHVSEKHLLRYCGEFDFRWSTRKINDYERMIESVRGVGDKRVMLKDLMPNHRNQLTK